MNQKIERQKTTELEYCELCDKKIKESPFTKRHLKSHGIIVTDSPTFNVTLKIETTGDEDEVDIEDMLSNVVTGMIRQYDLKKVTLKRRGMIDMFLDGSVKN